MFSNDIAQPAERYQGLSTSGVAFALSRWLKGLTLERYRRAPGKASGEDTTPHRQVMVVCPDGKMSEELASDLSFFCNRKIRRFSTWEILPFEELSPLVEVVSERISVLDDILSGQEIVVLTSPEALLQRVPRPELLSAASLRVAVGENYEREDLLSFLDTVGYRRRTLTEELGQFSVRGAVIDLYPSGALNPVRLEFFGDTLESIRIFDADTQRSLRPLGELRVLPAREDVQPSRLLRSPLAARFQLNREEEIENVVRRLRESSEDSLVPTRLLDVYEDALRTGADLPGIEQLLPFVQSPLASVLDYFAEDYDVVFVDELGILKGFESFESVIRERASRAREQGLIISDDNPSYLTSDAVLETLHKRLRLGFDALSLIHFDEPSEFPHDVEGQDAARIIGPVKLEIRAHGDLLINLKRNKHTDFPFKPLADEIILRRAQGYEIAIAVSHSSKFRRIIELLESYRIVAEQEPRSFEDWFQNFEDGLGAKNKTNNPVTLLTGVLSSGVRVSREALLIISDHEIFPDISHRKPARSAQQAKRILGAASQMKEDDYVVHIDHGIALYRGLKQITVDGKTSDFLQLEYAEGSKLFVPIENISRVQKYVGAEGIKPALSRLGGKSWSATKEKVRKNVQELAGQLLNLYAQRELARGFSFGELDEDDKHFADTFPFEETKDQEAAIRDVLTDMGRPRPMERLVCGDVGYGKTEVALRAAFKAVNKGKQVAVLVPTTILADQHYQTFNNRLSEFGFTIRGVSRFVTPQRNKETLKSLADGKVDVVVGTHRLLQKDVYFNDLGLVIIDEEHRFGVKDKEKLKSLKKEIDVLTLTATPIPRTLQMSLLSIRDLSVIETPPTNRQVIQTFVGNYQHATAREAILRELSRQGQVFYIHNRVQNIEMVTDELRTIVPEARIEFAHGQMDEKRLEAVMHRFVSHEFDVLVATTIVESGLDIPNANTIIIRNADKLGLAELYQLRGRVGRSSRRAYAYLLVQNAQTLTGDAKKRLQVLQSLDDLGMGFRLALQDMEIRGAGNLLGKDQSGKVELVGFELYSRILKEAVRELKRRQNRDMKAFSDELPLEVLIDPEINIGFSSHIPTSYIPDVEERLLLYQRLVEIRDDVEAADLEEEIQDRFGNPPHEVRTLIEVMRFRSALRRAGIVTAIRRGLSLSLVFHREASINTEKLTELIGRSKGRMKMTGPDSIVLILDEEPDSPIVLTRKVKALSELVT